MYVDVDMNNVMDTRIFHDTFNNAINRLVLQNSQLVHATEFQTQFSASFVYKWLQANNYQVHIRGREVYTEKTLIDNHVAWITKWCDI